MDGLVHGPCEVKPSGPSRRFPAWLAQARWCARRVAQSQKARGRAAKRDMPAPCAQMEQMRRVSEGRASLFRERHRLMHTVVPASCPGEVMVDSASRQCELETVLLVLAAREIGRIHTQVPLALPHLVRCPHRLETIQQQVTAHVGAEAIHLMAWA